MKHEIAYRCGHQGSVVLLGSAKHREARRQWLEGTDCPDCYRAARLQVAREATSHLPALTGSEKQINWAIQIRAEFMEWIKQGIPETEQGRLALTALEAAVSTLPEAKWWIDNRNSLRTALAPVYTGKLRELMVRPT